MGTCCVAGYPAISGASANHPAALDPATKVCPDCAETIEAVARLCPLMLGRQGGHLCGPSIPDNRRQAAIPHGQMLPNCCRSGTEGEVRTRTGLLPAVFKTAASAGSATSARPVVRTRSS